MTSVTVNSDRGEYVGTNASFENASGNNKTLGVSNRNDETRHNIPDDVNELSVPGTHFDRQAHTHHKVTGELSTDEKTIASFIRVIGPSVNVKQLREQNAVQIRMRKDYKI